MKLAASGRRLRRLAAGTGLCVAALLPACGGGDGSPPPRAAYFIDGLEYAFDYALDAQGRVASYRISRRPEVDYGIDPLHDTHPAECRGDLRGSYACDSYFGTMLGEGGRVIRTTRSTGSIIGSRTDYTWGSIGLAIQEATWTGPGNHDSGSSRSVLTYGDGGRLAEVRTECRQANLALWGGRNTTASITATPEGRLQSAALLVETAGSFEADCDPALFAGGGLATEWTYDERGFMSRAGALAYSTDAQGWLTGRTGPGDVRDTWLIVRAGDLVAEEHFTQAEPRAFYGNRGAQRVRYEPGSLPTEPLFVPRALTGLHGSDYFGIASSHHR